MFDYTIHGITCSSSFRLDELLAAYKKEGNLIQKQPSCEKSGGPQEGHCEKRCEIQVGGQEMAVMVG